MFEIKFELADSYNYTWGLPFETGFPVYERTLWFHNYWHYSIGCALAYVITIFSVQNYMQDRKAYDLRLPLTIWNWALALFSITGLVRIMPEFWHSLVNNGFQYSICNSCYARGVSAFWVWIFAMSKVVELGDTLFVVLRKQPLLFLHWYHHISVLIYTWHAWPHHTAPGRWFATMNYAVHTLMYAYYALRAQKFRFPRWVPMCITVMQLTQMVVGTYISISTYFIKKRGVSCQQTDSNLRFSLLMYTSYFILFAHYFYKVYMDHKGKFAAKKFESKKNDDLTNEINGNTLANIVHSEVLNGKRKLIENGSPRNGYNLRKRMEE